MSSDWKRRAQWWAVLHASMTTFRGLSVRTDSKNELRETFARCTTRPRRSAPWTGTPDSRGQCRERRFP
jgi:hypothetical protein